MKARAGRAAHRARGAPNPTAADGGAAPAGAGTLLRGLRRRRSPAALPTSHVGLSVNASQPLDLALHSYFWKPAQALAKSLQLQVYAAALPAPLPSPVLDLGCGSGEMGSMLRELGLIDGTMYGIDISLPDVLKATRLSAHAGLLQATATQLPFKDRSFSSIVANDVLTSIPEGIDRCLREMHRVLKDDGILVYSVPSTDFGRMMFWPPLLHRIAPSLARLYVARLYVRLPLFAAYTADEWPRVSDRYGFETLESRRFFSPAAGRRWNLLAMQALRVFGIVKFMRKRYVITALRPMLSRSLRRIEAAERAAATNFGCLLVVARKKTPGQTPG
jgi:ubiquinone/menaquinone biosynthesis C-methylase UbiE